MSPVSTSSYGPGDRGFHGVTTVSRHGQAAIPAKTRGDLRIEVGTQLVVLTDPNEGIAPIPLEPLLSKQDSPMTELVRSMLPGVTQPDGESVDGAAGKHVSDAEKAADDGGGSR